jgi:sugar lactone lactonase YvrE
MSMRRSVALGTAGVAAGAAVAGVFASLSSRGVSMRRGRPGRSYYPPVVPAPELELVHAFYGPTVTGVASSREGRLFVCHPRWEDPVAFTVGEITGGREVPFPDPSANDPSQPGALYSVQSVVVDPRDRLWALDTGSLDLGPADRARAKLVRIDLASGRLEQSIHFPPHVLLEGSYLNDVRFDLARGPDGLAFITDSALGGPSAIIVVDLASGRSWRRLSGHPATSAERTFAALLEGRPVVLRKPGRFPRPARVGADGIAISAGGRRLFFCPLAGRALWSVSVDTLADERQPEAAVERTLEREERRFASDGLEADATGRLFLTDWEHNAIVVREERGRYRTLVSDERLWWPDSLSLGRDGFLYVTANQLHRQAKFHGGTDLREPPWFLFRARVDALPVHLDRPQA